MNAGPTTILVVDDSALYRQSIHNVLREVESASIVGVARNGVEAIEKIEELDPDLLTLDVQMPGMDGIEVLREIKRRRLRPKAIMVSSLTAEGAKVTTDAQMEGAFDFILKPSSNDSAANRQTLRDALDEKITAFREASGQRKANRRRATAKQTIAPGGMQMKLERAGSSLLVRVTDDPPENGVRPSVDYLVRSVSNVLDGNALAVIMTGMGRDGLVGCRQLKQAGGYVFAQCQDNCVVYGMPKAVIEEDLADRTLPLGKIAPAIVRHLNRSRRS